MIWQYHQAIGLSIGAIILCTWVGSRTNASVACALVYSMISAILLFSNPDSQWGALQGGIDGSSATTLIHLILIPTLILIAPGLNFRLALCAIFSFNCLITLWNGWGMFNASSADTAMTAMALPLFFMNNGLIENIGKLKWVIIGVLLFTILVCLCFRSNRCS